MCYWLKQGNGFFAPLVTAHLVIINETVSATFFYRIWQGGLGGTSGLLLVILKLNKLKPNGFFLWKRISWWCLDNEKLAKLSAASHLDLRVDACYQDVK